MSITPTILEARRAKGAKAQKIGQLFENLFSVICSRSDVIATRLPDGCKQLGARKLIRVKTPWDWILTNSGRSAFIDTKTCNHRNFPHSNIDSNQVREMERHELRGAIAGYVIWLRSSDEIFFVPALTLRKCMSSKGSIAASHPEAIPLGSSQTAQMKNLFTLSEPARARP